MARPYRQPRRFNLVSFLLLLLAAAAIYGAVQFSPAYYRKWEAQGIISESANAVYPRRFVQGWKATEFQEEVKERTIRELRKAGIDDPGLQVRIEADRHQVKVGASYAEHVVHPFIDKTTVLHFEPEYAIDAEQ
jgi:hypothetical protein